MITGEGIELRAGARVLISDAAVQVRAGDRIGLVGRNGAGKTTTMRVLAGLDTPHAGSVRHTGPVDYLPQDPRKGDLSVSARDRVLSARGLDEITREMEKARAAMAEMADPARQEAAIARYGELEQRFGDLGGYAADSEAAQVCARLGVPERVLGAPLHALSGGQRRRVELARILFSAGDDHGGDGGRTLLLDEPTNHLDADSIAWLREFLAAYKGGVVLISHDTSLLAEVVNQVWLLDPARSSIDVYGTGWAVFQTTRSTEEQRRRRERTAAEKKASALRGQAARMGANANRAAAAKQMSRRATDLLDSVEPKRAAQKRARIRFPEPAPCGRTPLTATAVGKSYGSLEVLAGVDLAVDRGSRVVVLGPNGAGKTTLLRVLAGVEAPDTGSVEPGHGLRLGYFAQEHDTLDFDASVWANVRHLAPDAPEQQLRALLGSFLFAGDQLEQPAGTLSGGERTRLALASMVSGAANVLLLDEPTNNLDPASREQVLEAMRGFSGAVVLVTHDQAAVQALRPERVVLLPDGTEDLYSDEYLELVALE